MDSPQQAKRRRLLESSSLEDLHDNLLLEILIRIADFKCLFQYTSVCKRWFSLISSPDFRCRYISLQSSMKHKNLPFTFLGISSGNSNPKSNFSKEPIFQSPGFSFNFLPFSSKIRILATCNDLVLCCDSKNSKRKTVYYICNPLTMKWRALPPTPDSAIYVDRLDPSVCFICEPYYKEDQLQGHYGIALNTRQRFKVVRIVLAMPEGICLEIFSSETGQWNQTVLSLPKDLALEYVLEAEACNDGKKLILLCSRPDQLVSITLEGENFDRCLRIWTTPLPSLMFRSGITCCKRNSRLAILDVFYHVQIWELQEHDEWILLQSDCIRNQIIDLLSKNNITSRTQYVQPVSGFHPHNRDLLFMNLVFEGRIASYDMRTKSLNIVLNLCHEKNFYTLYPFVRPSWPTPVPQISDFLCSLKINSLFIVQSHQDWNKNGGWCDVNTYSDDIAIIVFDDVAPQSHINDNVIIVGANVALGTYNDNNLSLL